MMYPEKDKIKSAKKSKSKRSTKREEVQTEMEDLGNVSKTSDATEGSGATQTMDVKTMMS